MAQTIGLVLAGGAGRRMGRSKGDLDLDGANLAERAARTLWPLCSSVVISIAPGARNPTPRFAAVEDEGPAFRGPLAGILPAFAPREMPICWCWRATTRGSTAGCCSRSCTRPGRTMAS